MAGQPSRAPTGVEGLDKVLLGGVTRGSLFLLEGAPGTGKTTIALQFLLEGAKEHERALYVTLSETRQELLNTATSHGWTFGNEIELWNCNLPKAYSIRTSNKHYSTLPTSN